MKVSGLLFYFPCFSSVFESGKGDEQVQSATALILLCIQLGLTEEGETLFRNIQSTLLDLMLDNSASLNARAKVRFFQPFSQ